MGGGIGECYIIFFLYDMWTTLKGAWDVLQKLWALCVKNRLCALKCIL